MRIKSVSNFLWLFPFLGFIFGYYLLHAFLQKKDLETPNVIGKSIQSGMNVLSGNGLSIRLLREQEDPDLPEGVVLDQIPRPNQKVRPNQHVFVTISKKPKPVLTPDFIGQNQKFITTKSAKMGMQTRVFWIKSNYPTNTCIAQYPQFGQELGMGKAVAYLSSGSEVLYIVPNLKDCYVDQLSELFKRGDIKLDVFHTKHVENNHFCSDCKVIDQKPMPGSIVDLSKTLYMQVQVA